jgi:hypothetical protein
MTSRINHAGFHRSHPVLGRGLLSAEAVSASVLAEVVVRLSAFSPVSSRTAFQLLPHIMQLADRGTLRSYSSAALRSGGADQGRPAVPPADVQVFFVFVEVGIGHGMPAGAALLCAGANRRGFLLPTKLAIAAVGASFCEEPGTGS